MDGPPSVRPYLRRRGGNLCTRQRALDGRTSAVVQGSLRCLLSPLGIIFALFVAFTASQVWTDAEKAKAEIDREASRLIHSDCRVWMLEFDASIFGGELPVGLGVVG